MEDNIKKALLDGSATIQTKIEIITDNNEENIILDEQNSVVSWDYEDFRYVKDEGWIGQFVARQVNGVVKNISDDFSMTDKEFILHMGVKIGDNTTWYSLGNFLVNKVTDDEVNDKTSFEALDYTKKFNQTYVDSITYPCTALELAQNVCEQCGCELGNTDFKHNDWEITGNVFTNGESCREVLKAIGKLAYSWVRIDWDNNVYIDFIKKTEVNEYNKINNSNYYSLTTQKEKFGAVNRVIIGYKDIEGERTKVEDTESIDANGVNEITIYDNPLVYNQELREKAIVGAEDLFGLEYLPLETLTVGHPWLKGDELVEVRDMEGKVHKTIPFDRTIQYFGHIKTKINVATNTKTNTEYAYESGIGGRLRKTEIMVDKINGQITEVIEEQDETTKKLNETISTVEETKQTISSVETTVEDITTTTQTSTGGNNLYITDSLESNALEYHVEGKSEQETSVQGNNILGLPEGYSHTSGSLTVSVEDGIIIVNGSTTGVVTFDIPIPKLKLSGDYVYSISGEGDNKNNISLTLYDADKAKIGTYIVPPSDSSKRNQYKLSAVDNTVEYIHFYAGANYTFDNVKLYYMINEGTTLLPFEKFVPNSPSPDYPSEIKTIPSIGNLFDKDNYNLYNGYTNSSKAFVSSNNAYMVYIKCNPNITYTISREVLESNFTVTSSSNIPTTGETATNRIVNNNATSITVTTGNNDNYLGIYVKYTGNSNYSLEEILDSIMIEEGSMAHDYVPYGAWAKVKIIGKNLINFKNETSTLNGVETVYDKTTLLMNGTTSTTGNVLNQISGISIAQRRKVGRFKAGTYAITINKTSGDYTQPSGVDNLLYLRSYTDNQNNGLTLLKFSYKKMFGTHTFTLIEDRDIHFQWYVNGAGAVFDNLGIEFQIEEITEENPSATEYEQYKEKEVLIDLNKPNLLETPYTENNKLTATATKDDFHVTTNYKAYLEAGKTYTFSCNTDGTFGTTTGEDTVECWLLLDKTTTALIQIKTNPIIITPTTSGEYYLRYDINKNNLTYSFWDFAIYEGTNNIPYHELSSIGDTKDELTIIDGQVVIDKKIGKLVLDGSESWVLNPGYSTNNVFYTSKPSTLKQNETKMLSNITNNFVTNLDGVSDGIAIGGYLNIKVPNITSVTDFKTWLNENNTTIYYALAEPQQITLPNANIELFEGVNHISLVDDLETTTSIKYYRNTPIAQDYVIQQQLDETNSNLSTTTDKTNQNASDINATNTNLNNNYYNKDQIDVINSSTTQEITTIKKEVDTKITAEDLTIAINQIKTTGATSVETTTGYKFNEEGLSIQKSDSEMSSLLDNDGLVVKRNETEMLTVRSSGVEAENITVRTYFTIGDNTRAENYKGGTGFFYIGGDN